MRESSFKAYFSLEFDNDYLGSSFNKLLGFLFFLDFFSGLDPNLESKKAMISSC